MNFFCWSIYLLFWRNVDWIKIYFLNHLLIISFNDQTHMISQFMNIENSLDHELNYFVDWFSFVVFIFDITCCLECWIRFTKKQQNASLYIFISCSDKLREFRWQEISSISLHNRKVIDGVSIEKVTQAQ
jgi:hypothetical protein